jgi:hypothetical protein
LINHYRFYKYSVGKSLFLVGDVLNPDSYSDQVLEAKLIVSPSSYSFSDYSEVASEQFVLEKIRMISDDVMEKEYSFPTHSDAMSLLLASSKLDVGSAVYGRIIASLNMEADFKASLPSVSPLAASVSSAGDVDNPTVLDAYLSSLGESSDDSQVLLFRGSDSIYTNTVDDDIIDLVPKNMFKTNGEHSQIGSEWGYFANTYTDVGNNKITSLLVFDVFQIKADTSNPDIVAIKPVISTYYDVVISKIPAYLTASINGTSYSVTSSAASFTDAWNNPRIVARDTYLKLYPYLQGGQEYVLRLSRTNGSSKRVFGTAKINAYLSNNSMSQTGSNTDGTLNYSWKAISYNGFSINNRFIPLASGLYTVVLSTPSGYSGFVDAYIRILDESFQEIAHDDDGWGHVTAGIRMHMQANKAYYIISRLYSATSSGNYEIDVLSKTICRSSVARFWRSRFRFQI